jgi:RNA-directed DNA polymerase
VQAAFPERREVNGERARWQPHLIRYADDFVILHHDLAALEQAKQVAADWLGRMGLELKPSKTRIVHTLEPYQGRRPGFDFLGFHVRQYPVGYHRCGSTRQGFKTLIKPSKDAQKRHLQSLAVVVKRHRAATQQRLIEALNWAVDGWANYYRAQVSSEVFSEMDHLLFIKLRRWARRRHPDKSETWTASRYWRQVDGRKWVFTTGNRALVTHARPIVRHVKVAGDASPFNGDAVYWASRLGRHPELSAGWATLLKRQHGRCAHCGLYFQTLDEVIESDHTIPLALQGTTRIENRQLVHGHCHDRKTASDGSDLVRRSKVGPGWNGPKRPKSGGIHAKDHQAQRPAQARAARPGRRGAV